MTAARGTRQGIGIVLMLMLAACGGGGDSDDSGGSNSGSGSGGGGDGIPNDTVAEVLSDLNVDTRATPRTTAEGDELGDDWSPLGARTTLGKFAEVAVVGAPINDPGISTSESPLAVLNLSPQLNNRYSWESPLVDHPVSTLEWASAEERLASVAADVDGDGVEEIVIIWQLDGDVQLAVQRSGEDAYRLDEAYPVDTASWSRLELAAGDFDGNGSIDLAMAGIDTTGGAVIKLLANEAGRFSFTGVQQRLQGGLITGIDLASGDIDNDDAMELAVSVSLRDNATPSSRFQVFDDADSAFVELATGVLSAATANGTENAVQSSIELGDVDADGRDEIVIAGLNRIGTVGREFDYSDFRYLIEVLDDAEQGFVSLASRTDPSLLPGENMQASSSGAQHRLNHVALALADIDDDGAKEILVTQRLYQSLKASPGAIRPFVYESGNDVVEAVIPSQSWFTRTGSSGRQFDFSDKSASVAAGDVTGDRREDIVLYSQRTGNLAQQVEVWSLDQIAGWTMVASYETRRSASHVGPFNATVVLPDIEMEEGTAHLQYSQGSHKLVFTEPLIIAAIAAPPCARDLGQNLDACRSAFGTSVSNTSVNTSGTTLSARVSVGAGVNLQAGVEFLGVGGGVTASREVSVALEGALRRYTSDTYTITRSLTYTTGPLEDSVLLTTIPVDIYTYEILSHSQPNLVGTTVDIRLPRDMVTVLVSLDFYESVRLPTAPRIAGTVFTHVEGDPSSYPDLSARSAIENRYETLTGQTATVGEGNGFTTSTISEFNATSRGTSADWTASLNIRSTVGVTGSAAGNEAEAYGMAEVGVGYGEDATLEITRGEDTVVQGAVSNINSASFSAGSQYDWGLLNYLYDGGQGQPFEVLNFWVAE